MVHLVNIYLIKLTICSQLSACHYNCYQLRSQERSKALYSSVMRLIFSQSPAVINLRCWCLASHKTTITDCDA